MLGRKGSLAAVTAVVCVGAFVAVSWPRGLDVSLSTRGAPAPSTPITMPSPAPQVLTPDSTPAEPPPTVVVERGQGRRLRVGVAGPATSPATVADAIGSQVGIYSAPGDAEPDDVMDNPTWEGLPAVFLVQQRQGDWLNVQVSMRPNMATAWIRASEVTLRQVPYRILIDTGARRLTVYNGGSVAFETSVAPGTSDSPTPTGDFFVDGVVRLADDSGPYGAYQVSVAAFSNVYYSFGAGNGQIAIHGTNNPALIGTPASHGCVRMTNEDITNLTTMAPLGTPVRIV